MAGRWVVAGLVVVGAVVVLRPDGPVGPPTDAELQTCPDGMRRVTSTIPFYGELIPTEGETYAVASSLRMRDRLASGRSMVELSGLQTVFGAGPVSPSRAVDRTAKLARAATEAGSRLLVQARGSDPSEAPYLAVVAVLRPDGRFVFTLFCGQGDEEAALLEERARSSGRTPTEALLALVRDPQGPDATAVRQLHESPPPLPWAQRSPLQRDYSDAPAAVRRQLHEIAVSIEVPTAWRSFPDVVALRTPVARGHGAAAFGAFDVNGRMRLGTTVQDGQPLVVALTDGRFGELGTLASVPEATWRKYLGRDKTLVLRAPPDLLDRDSLLRAVAVGSVLRPITRS